MEGSVVAVEVAVLFVDGHFVELVERRVYKSGKFAVSETRTWRKNS